MYVAGNCGNQAFPEMPRHLQKLQAFPEIPKQLQKFLVYYLVSIFLNLFKFWETAENLEEATL